jgi:hypothetical protein
MVRLGLRIVGISLLCAWLSGCAEIPIARYVYQDGEFGVVAIPMNTYGDKRNFRGEAEQLMSRHFPEGYEIIRAEEVNEGERLLDLGRRTELTTEPTISALSQVIRLGKIDRTTSYEEKDKLQARECRIIYKRRTTYPIANASQFAALASTKLPLYLDPNEMIRHKCAEMLANNDAPGKKGSDSSVHKASTDAPKAATASTSPAK